MTISVSPGSSYEFGILHLFDVSPSLITQAVEAGVFIKKQPNGIFRVGALGTVISVDVSVKATAITLAKSGNLGSMSKGAFKAAFESALSEVIGSLLPIKSTESPPPTKSDETTPSLAASEPVDLSAATTLLQPVKGTSAGSVYYVVALLDGIALAMRTKGPRLSLRVAGAGLPKYVAPLESMGFHLKPQYGSVHFEAITVELVHKTIGAVLGGLGFQNVKSIAEVSKLVGL